MIGDGSLATHSEQIIIKFESMNDNNYSYNNAYRIRRNKRTVSLKSYEKNLKFFFIKFVSNLFF